MYLEMVGATVVCILAIGTAKYWLSNKKKQTDKISLDFLRIFIISPTNELLKELSRVEDSLLLSQLTSASKLIKEGVDNLVVTIENRVLTNGLIGIDAADFFKMATQPIDALKTIYTNLVAYASRNAY